MLQIKTLIRERSREFGISKKRTLFGKKTNRIEVQKNKKENKLIRSGRKDLKCSFLKLVRWKIKIK